MLDIRLPGATGDKVAQRLRKSPVLGDIVIVFMTAYHLTPQEEEQILESAGTKHILYKPLPTAPELQAMLRSAINGNATDG